MKRSTKRLLLQPFLVQWFMPLRYWKFHLPLLVSDLKAHSNIPNFKKKKKEKKKRKKRKKKGKVIPLQPRCGPQGG